MDAKRLANWDPRIKGNSGIIVNSIHSNMFELEDRNLGITVAASSIPQQDGDKSTPPETYNVCSSKVDVSGVREAILSVLAERARLDINSANMLMSRSSIALKTCDQEPITLSELVNFMRECASRAEVV